MKFLQKWIPLAIHFISFSKGITRNPLESPPDFSKPDPRKVEEEANKNSNLSFDYNSTNRQFDDEMKEDVIYDDDEGSTSVDHIAYYSFLENEVKGNPYEDYRSQESFRNRLQNSPDNETEYQNGSNEVIFEQQENIQRTFTLATEVTLKDNDSQFIAKNIEIYGTENDTLPLEMSYRFYDETPKEYDENQDDDLTTTLTTSEYTDVIKLTGVANCLDNDTKSQLSNFLSLWHEVTDAAGDENITSMWNSRLKSILDEAKSEWTNALLIKLQKEACDLWRDILVNLDGHPNITKWNETMIAQWTQFTKTSLIKIYEQNNIKPEDDNIIIQLEQGPIFTKKENITEDRFFYSFKGIPYAEPPTGHLRLRDPVPASMWVGIRNGSIDVPQCPQLEFYITTGNEDCLYLNVYTPRPFKSDLPVMVWIHGGNFIVGGSHEFSPTPLLQKDIVLVVMQYRLGTLGFLSTEDNVLPGNLGLKDQSMALQWVRDNIHDLGGDPNKVTLFGQGAGAVTAHLHTFSPISKGLFQRVILQSGNALNQWAIRSDHKRISTEIGKKYKCVEGKNWDSTVFLKCLQDLPLHDIVAMPSLFMMIVSLPLVMTPRVDGDFLPDHPASLLREGKFHQVDVISGVNKHEGASTALLFVLNPWLANDLLDNFEIAGPILMALDREYEPVKLANVIYSYYLRSQNISWEVANQTVQMMSDLSFNWPHDEVTHFHAVHTSKDTKTYAYELQYSGQHSFTDLYGPEAGDYWITNADDLPYLFNYTMIILQERNDFEIRELMVNLWTNFALHGDPTPDDSLGVKWLPVNENSLDFLAIDSVPSMQEYDRANVLKFWHILSTQTNKLLYPQGPPDINSHFEN